MTFQEYLPRPPVPPILGILLALIFAGLLGAFVDRSRGPEGSSVEWITPNPVDPSTLPPYEKKVLAAYPVDGAAVYISVVRVLSADTEGRRMDFWLPSSAVEYDHPNLGLPLVYTAEPSIRDELLIARKPAFGKGPNQP